MNHDLDKLLKEQCRHYSKKEGPMNLSEVNELRNLTPQWQFCANDNVLARTFHFDSYVDTISFVNKVAEIAEHQDHHPELNVSYRRCKVCYETHTVNGVTRNDFICAALVDAIE